MEDIRYSELQFLQAVEKRTGLAVEFAEAIRKGVESLSLKYKDIALPKVTASIGVATTPPADRKMEIKSLAESRKRQAKENGRNRVIPV